MSKRFQKLTRPAIRALGPGGRIQEHGIIAACMASGDIRYSVNVQINGRRVHRVIGRESEGTTRTQAEAWLEQAATQARHGNLDLPKGRRQHLTFTEASRIYLKRLEEGDGKNITEKRRHLRTHLRPFFGTMRCDQISKFDVERFRKEKRDADYAEASINQWLATYRHMGRSLADWQITKAPFPMVKLKDPGNRRDFVLSADEKEALFKAAGQDQRAEVIWLFFKIALGTSLRYSEVLSLRFDRFSPDRRRIKVRVKGGAERQQPMTTEVRDLILAERKLADDPDGWIFPSSRSKSGHLVSIRKTIRRVVKAAGLPAEVTAHILRHSSITAMAEVESRLQVIQDFSGPKTAAMALRYIHARETVTNDAVDAMEEKSRSEGSKDGDTVVPLDRKQ